MTVTVTLQQLHALARQALVSAGTSPGNAHQVADALVAADADGLSSHGVSRIPAYADQARAGKVNGRAVPKITQLAAAALCVDACDGFAYPAIAMGLERAAAVVRETGVVALAVGRSHHFGAAGYHVEHVAQRGLVALAFGNSPAAIAPWGGSKALFGTNPIACACPRREKPPLVIDLSLSKVARGKMMIAAQRGEPIPEGWALDPEGRPTTDPKAAMAGTVLPMGDAKGAALVLMVEILAAALTGSNFGYQASSFFNAEGPPPRVGQLFVVFDPRAFASADFSDRLEQLLAAVLAQPGTRLPGDRRLANRERARLNGVEIPDVLYRELLQRGEGRA